MASAAAEKQRLRDWLRDSVGEGATAFADAIIVSFEAAGYAPDEWVQTLASMGASELEGFLNAVSTHFTAEGQQVDTAHVQSITEKLAAVPLFANVAKPGSEFGKVLSLELVPKRVPVGELIIRRGDVGREMFFLTQGEVEVLISLDKPPVTTLHPGASFGETALMAEEPRNAYVRASRGAAGSAGAGAAAEFVELLVLSSAGLRKTLEKFPDIEDALEEEAWQRRSQLEATAQLRPSSPALSEADESAELVDGQQTVRLEKGPSGFGLQIDRDGRVSSYGESHSTAAPGPAYLAGVRIGARIVAVNGCACERKSDIIGVLSNPAKCPGASVAFTFVDLAPAVEDKDLKIAQLAAELSSAKEELVSAQQEVSALVTQNEALSEKAVAHDGLLEKHRVLEAELSMSSESCAELDSSLTAKSAQLDALESSHALQAAELASHTAASAESAESGTAAAGEISRLSAELSSAKEELVSAQQEVSALVTQNEADRDSAAKLAEQLRTEHAGSSHKIEQLEAAVARTSVGVDQAGARVPATGSPALGLPNPLVDVHSSSARAAAYSRADVGALEFATRVTQADASGGHMTYLVELYSRGQLHASVVRRYSEFDALRKQLCSGEDGKTSAIALLHFPTKMPLRGKRHAKVVQRREADLQAWLNAALRISKRPSMRIAITNWFDI